MFERPGVPRRLERHFRNTSSSGVHSESYRALPSPVGHFGVVSYPATGRSTSSPSYITPAPTSTLLPITFLSYPSHRALSFLLFLTFWLFAFSSQPPCSSLLVIVRIPTV